MEWYEQYENLDWKTTKNLQINLHHLKKYLFLQKAMLGKRREDKL